MREPARLTETRSRARAGLKKILVPIDFSEPSLKALRYAVAFALQFDAALCLVHVVEPASLLKDASHMMLTVSEREVANVLHHKLVMLARKKIDPFVPVTPLVCIGKPFDEIVKSAKTFNVDLVIIATRGRAGKRRALPGSTAERVVRYAPCPVLVVRDKEHDFVRQGKPTTERESL